MGIKLLLADDSPTIGKILSMALQSEAYDIKSVLTADDALRELKAEPPFFFLVDLTLPGKDGYEFAKLIRSDSKLNKIKVLLLSSAFDPVDPQKLAQSGADGFIVKPFDPSDLRKKLREIADAPPAFPMGSHVSGSVSGMQVHAQIDTPPPAPSLGQTPSALAPEADLGGDADSILAQLMGNEESELPPAEPPFTNPSLTTIGVDAPEAPPTPQAPIESVLDLSESFSGDRTAMIDFAEAEKEKSLSKITPAISTPAPAAQEPLSANAQALAAFFEAELEGTPPGAPQAAAADIPPPAPSAKVEDEAFFDASSESIEWASPAKENLDSWSSNTPSATPTMEKPPILGQELSNQTNPSIAMLNPPPFSPPKENSAPPTFKKAPTATTPSTGSGATSAGNPLFDVGGSNFTFADDYIQRITKAFSGAINEVAVPNIHEGVFHSESSDSAPSHSPSPSPSPSPSLKTKTTSSGLTSGAWNPEDAKKIEQMVKDEVQMVVREVAEKVAWEIIPELAENIIKKELDKVLKQLET